MRENVNSCLKVQTNAVTIKNNENIQVTPIHPQCDSHRQVATSGPLPTKGNWSAATAHHHCSGVIITHHHLSQSQQGFSLFSRFDIISQSHNLGLNINNNYF